MATYTPARFFHGQAAASETTIYTVPGATSAILKEVVVANTTASAVDFTLSLVPSGGSAGADDRLVPTSSIPAGTTVSFVFFQVLATGDFLSAFASAATSLTVTASGVTFV